MIALALTSPLTGQDNTPAEPALQIIWAEGYTSTTPFALDFHRFGVSYDTRIQPDIALGIGLSSEKRNGCLIYLADATEADCRSYVTEVPIQALWLSGGDHNLEVGGGITFAYSTGVRHEQPSIDPQFYVAIPFRFGYRYQPRDGGFSWRIAYAPSFLVNRSYNPVRFSLGVGYAF